MDHSGYNIHYKATSFKYLQAHTLKQKQKLCCAHCVVEPTQLQLRF